MMNPFILNLVDRLRRNDALLTELSTIKFPLSGNVSDKETTALVSALVVNETVKTAEIGTIPHNAPVNELLKNNKTITSLSIGSIGVAWKTVADSFSSNNTIKTLVLGNHNSIALEDASQAACKGLGQILSTTLARNLTLQNFGFETMEELCEGLSRNQSVRELTIRQCESNEMDCLSLLLDALPKTHIEKLCLLDLDIEEVCFDPLRDLTSLVELLVNDCIFEMYSLESLCECLQDHPTLRLLDLSRNELMTDSAESLAELISCNSGLVEVRLDENNLGNNGCTMLLNSLSHNRTLKRLSLRSTDIASLEIKEEGILRLQELDLSENIEFGSNGAVALSQVLHKCSNLQRLRLDACMISDRGLLALTHAIPSTVVELNLSNNEISGKGAVALAQNIGSILTLDLSSANISDETLRDFLHQLSKQDGNRLENLYLSFNEITNTGARHIANALKSRNCRLETLSIQFNEFDDAGLFTIVEALESNTSLHQLFPWNQSVTHTHLNTMDHWLRLNRAGRSRILENDKIVHWPAILAKAGHLYGVNALLYSFCERPELLLEFERRQM